jgi:5-methylcytosine-specific restriction enzyme subunit McrC
MEKVFEAYVAKNLKRVLGDLNWEISTQDKGYYLFDTPWQFALRPDIVITRDDGSRIIPDTKWKLLSNNPRQNYGISHADMYQMYAYSKKYNTPEVWLLYPLNEEMQNADISFQASNRDVVETKVRLFFVEVIGIKESLGELKRQLIKEIHHHFL